MTSIHINNIIHVGDWFRADEINGKQGYIFVYIDNDTRYWLASDLADNKFQHNADSPLEMTKKQAGKTSSILSPTTISIQ